MYENASRQCFTLTIGRRCASHRRAFRACIDVSRRQRHVIVNGRID